MIYDYPILFHLICHRDGLSKVYPAVKLTLKGGTLNYEYYISCTDCKLIDILYLHNN